MCFFSSLFSIVNFFPLQEDRDTHSKDWILFCRTASSSHVCVAGLELTKVKQRAVRVAKEKPENLNSPAKHLLAS